MKTRKIFSIVLALIACGLIVAPSGVSFPESTGDYENMANAYDLRASTERIMAVKHEAMKKEYEERFSYDRSLGSTQEARRMAQYCEAIAEKSHSLAKEYEKLAQWYRNRARNAKI